MTIVRRHSHPSERTREVAEVIVGGDSLASAAVPLVSSLAVARGNRDLLGWCRCAVAGGDEPVSVRVSEPFV